MKQQFLDQAALVSSIIIKMREARDKEVRGREMLQAEWDVKNFAMETRLRIEQQKLEDMIAECVMGR